jgi:ubiquinone/menaquinone biosynthesis C-methylase UbiE
MEASGSVGFDRAVEYYDRTRGLSGSTMAEVVRLLKGELLGRGRCLEIGVGTGRMALPLHQDGVDMAGVDLSEKMLRSLVGRAGGRAPFPLARADAVALPFADRTFGAAMVCHVLHLIPPWPSALRELVRVVRPGGVILIDAGAPRESWWKELQERFCREAGIERREPGLNDVAELERVMSEMGLSWRTLPPISHRSTRTMEERISWLEEGLFSFTWPLDEATRRSAGAGVRGWAAERFGPLEQPRTFETQVVWRAFELS